MRGNWVRVRLERRDMGRQNEHLLEGLDARFGLF